MRDVPIDLSILGDLVDARSTEWRALEASWSRSQRPTSASEAAVLTVESPSRLTELTVWRKGEAGLIVAEVQTGAVLGDEHYEVTSEVGLAGMLDDVEAVLAGVRHFGARLLSPGPGVVMASDPAPLTRWVVAHPALWGAASGFALLGIALGLFGLEYLRVWLVVSALFGLATFWAWRSTGPGHRVRAYLLRRFPK